MNEHEEREFELELNQFQPRKLRALPVRKFKDHARKRFLLAAAITILTVAAPVWLLRKKEWPRASGAKLIAPQAIEQNAAPAAHYALAVPALAVPALTDLALTNLALERPETFDDILSVKSRQMLPPLRGERSTLRVLAGE
jgi:hypothetical protein